MTVEENKSAKEQNRKGNKAIKKDERKNKRSHGWAEA
jgi:hypothetical protein